MEADTLTRRVTLSSVSPSSPATVRRFTRAEYDRMVETGFFHPEERLELIDGQIVEKMPQGSRHTTAVSLTGKALVAALGNGFEVRLQMPLALDELSEPEPDIAVVPGGPRDYRDHHPTSALLLVEVADSTLSFDRGRKLELYARCGIPEVWIVNLPESVVEVHRDPAGSTYRQRLRLESGDAVSLVARAGARLSVADLLP
jgi:Uma2 family endonuclease